MTNNTQSPHPNSHSPTSRPSAFQWPVPTTTTTTTTTSAYDNSNISVKEIIEKYYPNDHELLKHALMAKAEEDRKQTAQDVLKTEQARIHLRQLDLELMREQSRVNFSQPHIQPQPQQQQQQPQAQPYGYYSLAPMQQQTIARITGSTENQNAQNDYGAPASPVVYPHSAHPLCTPDNRLNPPRKYHLQLPSSQQPNTPISPHDNNNNDVLRKRVRTSISASNNNNSNTEEDKISHNKVMEALKAKIQRGSSSPLATTAPSTAFRDTNNNKRQRTLPKPTIEPLQMNTVQPSTPSPRSAKPILPPIDTSIGRIPTTNLPSHPMISPTSSPPHPSISSVRDTN